MRLFQKYRRELLEEKSWELHPRTALNEYSSICCGWFLLREEHRYDKAFRWIHSIDYSALISFLHCLLYILSTFKNQSREKCERKLEQTTATKKIASSHLNMFRVDKTKKTCCNFSISDWLSTLSWTFWLNNIYCEGSTDCCSFINCCMWNNGNYGWI